MSRAGMPNSEYLLKSIVAGLETISKANQNWTTPVTVKMPSFEPLDAQGNYTTQLMAVPSPAILLWLESLGENTARGNLGGAITGSLYITIMGLVKQKDGLQFALMGLAEDVRSVMRYDQSHPWPGTSNDSDGISSDQVGNFNMRVNSGDRGAAVGSFISLWKVDYRFTRTKG